MHREMKENLDHEPVNIFTLKWGDRYGPIFVNRLYSSIRGNLTRPFRFICFTDDATDLLSDIEYYPLPDVNLPKSHERTTWLKLGLFANDNHGVVGDCLFLDLDLIIVDNIDCFFDYLPGKRCIIHNWTQAHLIFKQRPNVGNSSIFRWRANTMQFVLDKFYSERDWALENFRPPQTYLTYALGEKYWWPDAWVKSFKRHSVPGFPLNLVGKPKLPRDVRILVFHGRPDPDEALKGYRAKRLHRRTRPAPWIVDFWGDGGDD